MRAVSAKGRYFFLAAPSNAKTYRAIAIVPLTSNRAQCSDHNPALERHLSLPGALFESLLDPLAPPIEDVSPRDIADVRLSRSPPPMDQSLATALHHGTEKGVDDVDSNHATTRATRDALVE